MTGVDPGTSCPLLVGVVISLITLKTVAHFLLKPICSIHRLLGTCPRGTLAWEHLETRVSPTPVGRGMDEETGVQAAS